MANNNLSPEDVPLISKEEPEDDHNSNMESKEHEAGDQHLAHEEHTLPLVGNTVNFSLSLPARQLLEHSKCKLLYSRYKDMNWFLRETETTMEQSEFFCNTNLMSTTLSV